MYYFWLGKDADRDDVESGPNLNINWQLATDIEASRDLIGFMYI